MSFRILFGMLHPPPPTLSYFLTQLITRSPKVFRRFHTEESDLCAAALDVKKLSIDHPMHLEDLVVEVESGRLKAALPHVYCSHHIHNMIRQKPTGPVISTTHVSTLSRVCLSQTRTVGRVQSLMF